MDIRNYDSLDKFFETFPEGNFAFITKFGQKTYDEIQADGETFLIFGRETKGLPEEIRQTHQDRCFRIPMEKEARSLNLANAVAVVVYDTLRRTGFRGLSK